VDRCKATEASATRDSLSCPDINDPLLFDDFVAQSKKPKATPAQPLNVEEAGFSTTPVVEVPLLNRRELRSKDRSLLRRFARVGVCPETLQDYLPGFYELCLSIVKDSPRSKIRMGLLNEKAAQGGSAPLPSLRLRFETFGKARPDR